MERMKLERKNKNLKENLDIERRGHLQLARRVKQLEEENKKLKERVSELEDVSKDYDLLSKDFIALGEENRKLKSDLEECECSFGFECDECEYWKRECKKLKEELKKYKKLHKYSNGELLTYSGD